MRKLLALVGLVAMLAAPYAETSHDHSLGQTHDDCPACQVKSNPGVAVQVVTDTVGQLDYRDGPLLSPSTLPAGGDPLRVAPKTSPPGPPA